jgi:ABC-type Mn2+/Zn2+ transport system permease subunit
MILNQKTVFIIRAVMGVIFGFILSRFFYPKAPPAFIIGLCIALVGLAYLSQYLRRRSKAKSKGGPQQ